MTKAVTMEGTRVRSRECLRDRESAGFIELLDEESGFDVFRDMQCLFLQNDLRFELVFI